MVAVLKEKYLRIVPYLDRRFLVFIYMALWYNQNIKINMANKTFHKRLFLCLIGMATHSVGGVRGFCLFVNLHLRNDLYIGLLRL